MLSGLSHQSISASPTCQHSDRIEAGDVACPSLWRYQFISQIVQVLRELGICFKSPLGDSLELYSGWDLISWTLSGKWFPFLKKKKKGAGAAFILRVTGTVRIMLLMFPGHCQEELVSPSEMLNATGHQFIVLKLNIPESGHRERVRELWQRMSFFGQRLKVGDVPDKDSYCLGGDDR